jgi:hypothetical protein
MVATPTPAPVPPPITPVTVNTGTTVVPWILAAALALVVLLISHCSYESSLNKDQALIKESLVSLNKAEAKSVKDSGRAVAAEHIADSLRLVAAHSDTIANVSLATAIKYRQAYMTLAARAPAVCDTTTAAANAGFQADDSTLATLIAENGTLKHSDSLYKSALDSTASDLRAVLAAGHGVQTAVKVEEKTQSSQSFLSRIAPQFGVGAAGGIDVVTGKPGAVVGLTLGWRF